MRKLPVRSTVELAYRFVFANFAALGSIVRPWATTALLAFALVCLLVGFGLSVDRGLALEYSLLRPGQQAAELTGLSIAVVAIGVYPVIVRWHRMIIRNVPAGETRRYSFTAGLLYLGRSALLGAATLLTVMLVGLLPVVLLRQAPLPDAIKSAIPTLFVAGAVVGTLLAVARVSLILPAGAVGDYKMTLRRSWEVTRGNSWRLLIGSVFSSGPALLANIGFNGFFNALPRAGGGVTTLLITLIGSTVLLVVTLMIQAGFLSYAYAFFTGEDETRG